jgi:hypothetical protein
MRRLLALLPLLALLGLGGCVAYAPTPGYYARPYYAPPPVAVYPRPYYGGGYGYRGGYYGGYRRW